MTLKFLASGTCGWWGRWRKIRFMRRYVRIGALCQRLKSRVDAQYSFPLISLQVADFSLVHGHPK